MNSFYKSISCLLIAFMSLTALLFSCSSVDISGSEVTNENVISLTGYVKDNTGKGVPNISATLTSLHFSDTTDGTGLYSIEISADSLNVLGVTLKDISDTLIITQNENRLGVFSIDNFVDSLPDTYLIQRNISGQLETTAKGFSKIEAIISSSADTSVYTQELWLNEITNEFSSFIYMHSHNDDRIYSIYVTVYDSLNHLVGRSQTINFPENAGDINVGSFKSLNAMPSVSISGDSTVRIGEVITLQANFIDNFDGTAISYQWDFGDGETDSSAVVSYTYTVAKEYVSTVTVIDNDSNVTSSTHPISVINGKTELVGLIDTVVSIDDIVDFSITAIEQEGIQKIIWDFGEGDAERPRYDSTIGSSTSAVTHKYPGKEAIEPLLGKVFPLTVTVIDSFGDTTRETASVTVGIHRPEITVLSKPDTALFGGDTMKISFSVSAARSITDYSFKVGDDEFIPCDSGIIEYVLPEMLETSLLVEVKVVDDKGFEDIEQVALDKGVGFFNTYISEPLHGAGFPQHQQLRSYYLSSGDYIITTAPGMKRITNRGKMIWRTKDLLISPEGQVAPSRRIKSNIQLSNGNIALMYEYDNSGWKYYGDQFYIINQNGGIGVHSDESYGTWGQERHDLMKVGNGFCKLDFLGYLCNYDNIANKISSVKAPFFSSDERMTATAFSEMGDLYVTLQSSIDSTVPKIVKFDTTGHTIWAKEFPATSNRYIHAMSGTTDNGIVLTGIKNSSDNTIGPLWIAKFSSSGELQWEHEYTGSSNTFATYFVEEVSDGNYLVGGGVHYDGLNASDSKIDMIIHKYSSRGQLLWEKRWESEQIPYTERVISTVAVSIVEDQLSKTYVVGAIQNDQNVYPRISSQIFNMSYDGDTNF